ncbi:hypothetical protein SERLA73DRAFT_17350, partial [Serpula lacrymans var. lacrymans S7.3]
KQPYHTHALFGQGWVLKLINGHPERICCKLGVHLHVFEKLVEILKDAGHEDSQHIILQEKLAIFLY